MCTSVALLTPPGKAALASLALVGPAAWEVIQPLFKKMSGGSLPEEPEAGRFWLGRLGTVMSDEVVLAVRATQPCLHLEVHCHGGPEVVRLLLDLFAASEVNLVSWHEIVPLIEPNRIRAEAMQSLPRALTVRTAAILLDQYHGALRQALEEIKQPLGQAMLDRHFRGSWPAALERMAESSILERLQLAQHRLADLLSRADLGSHLTTPWRVVIAGAPNVGKSSLVNALAGYQRSIVAPTPGTTRDVVTTTLAFDGWPVELIDTAGVRSAAESLESLGIEQALVAAATADLVLWLVDATAPPAWPVERPAHLRIIVNKIDQPAAWDVSTAGDAIRLSALTCEGMEELNAAISRWLVPQPPPPGTAVPFTNDQIAILEQAQRSIAADQWADAWTGLFRLLA